MIGVSGGAPGCGVVETRQHGLELEHHRAVGMGLRRGGLAGDVVASAAQPFVLIEVQSSNRLRCPDHTIPTAHMCVSQ